MRGLILLLAFAAMPAVAQVYKCTEGGKVVFSDYPCQRTDSKMIDVRPAAGGPVNRSTEYWAEQERRARIDAERNEAEIQREADRRLRATAVAPSSRSYTSEENAQLIERAKKAVLFKLIDPESGRFRSLSVQGGEVCGEVNGKNKFGGYTGFQTFWVKFNPEPDVWMGDILGPSAQRICAARIAAAAARE